MMSRRGCHNPEIVPIGVPARRPAGNVQWTACSRRSSVDKFVCVMICTIWPHLDGKRNGQSSGVVYPCPRACVAPALSLQPPLQQKLWTLSLASMPSWGFLSTGFKWCLHCNTVPSPQSKGRQHVPKKSPQGPTWPKLWCPLWSRSDMARLIGF